MPTEPRLRSAHPDDADVVVPLLVEALDALALELADVDTMRVALPLFRELFVARGHRYSHEQVCVLDVGGVVLAAILAYPGRDEAKLAAATLARLPSQGRRHQLESSPDEFYLDALAVAPAQRGRGLAAQMIAMACDQARVAGHGRAGLLVDEAKPGVRRLYQQIGFVADGEVMLAGHRHTHMSTVLR